MKKLNIGIRRVLSCVLNLVLIMIVILALLLVGARAFGVQFFTVLSGSMEPDYPTGSMVCVQEIDAGELEERDVITFRLGKETIVTHRIIEIVKDEADLSVVRFRTQGDANDVADGSLVDSEDIIGKVVFCIPRLGYLATYLQSRQGIYVVVAVGVVLFIISCLDSSDKKKKIQ